MAVKDGNHRLSVTLTDGEYAAVRAMADETGKSASKVAAGAVGGFFEQAGEIDGLRTALGVMAGQLADACWRARDWRQVRDVLEMGERAEWAGAMADAVRREVYGGGSFMSGEYRRAYDEWLASH